MDTVTLSERLSPREMTPEEKLIAVDKALVLSLQNYKPDVYIAYDEYVDMFRHVLFLEEEIRDMAGDKQPWQPKKNTTLIADVAKEYNIQPERLSSWTPSRVKGMYFREGTAPDGTKFTEIVASAADPYSPQETINSYEAN